MNAKKLQQKLEKLSQEKIEDVTCPKCNKDVFYLLCNRGSDFTKYEMVNTKETQIYGNDGKVHAGFQSHICKREEGK